MDERWYRDIIVSINRPLTLVNFSPSFVPDRGIITSFTYTARTITVIHRYRIVLSTVINYLSARNHGCVASCAIFAGSRTAVTSGGSGSAGVSRLGWAGRTATADSGAPELELSSTARASRRWARRGCSVCSVAESRPGTGRQTGVRSGLGWGGQTGVRSGLR